MKPQYYITEVSMYEVSIFGNAGAGYVLMYGPFDVRYAWDREDMDRWIRGLEQWGYEEVPAPTLAEHRKRVRA